jgi:hypothetical protein
MFQRLLIVVFALLGFAAPALAAGDDAPAWLRQAAAANIPQYDRQVHAVVLLNEKNVTVSDDGRVTTVTTYAVRILSREGRGAAVAREIYLTDSGKVREMRAWLIRPSGDVKRYGKDETLDVSLADDDVYNEARARTISASSEADAGAVFGYQATSESRSVFTQDEFEFQDRLPALVARYTLTLPANWHASSITFNHANVEPAISGTTYSWELKNLPYIDEEPHSPAVTNLAPRLAISYFPADGAKPAPGRFFANWTEVSRWLSELHDPQAIPDDKLTAKAKELTAGTKTEFERIQAIARYVQSTQYISIQIGLGRGGGYRPHPAAEVFAKSYGDCKDKDNLMRAMLKAVGITAYPVVVYAGDPTYVREEWASPQQFNHCIIAIRVSDETQATSIVRHPALGRLLIFDATDDQTPVGDLPDHEQGSLALIVAGSDGALMRMPTTPPEANRWERQAEVNLAPDGSITVAVRDLAVGQSAARARRMFKNRSRQDYLKIIEGWITTGGATLAKLTRVEPEDDPIAGRFALRIEFAADRYAPLMRDRLLVFKPGVVSHGQSVWLTSASRKHPVVLAARAYTETMRVTLPAGFEVDEIPEPLRIESSFGAYAATCEVKDGQIIFTRALVQRAATIPVEQYAEVRSFFARINAVEDAPVVFAKK